MQREIDNYRKNDYRARDARLFNEWELIDKRYYDDPQATYIIRRRNGLGLPVKYEIIFHVKSIIGVKEPDGKGLKYPIFGNLHKMSITIPNSYPEVSGQPEFFFTTDVWHPNVRFFGDFKGRVCLNTVDSGTQTNLITYIDRVISYLTYDDYHAKNEYPYPEDLDVAEWVLKQAEPNGWLNFSQL